MLALLRDTCVRYGSLWRAAWAPGDKPIAGRSPRHYLLTTLLLLGLPLFALYHLVGLALDELLFRGYRRVEVRQPTFILGVPRSGTTALHRTLAADPSWTTFTTWECLFGISVTWRLFWRGVGRVDRYVGGPGRRLVSWGEGRLFGALEQTHPVRLDAPEEDYLILLPLLASFVLVVPFTDARSAWELGYFDRDLSPGQRRRIMAFYERCLQKHLYVHGPQRRLLSKNASFAPMARSLAAQFPDCRILCCLRDPAAAVPSQLHAVEDGMAAIHGRYDAHRLGHQFLQLLAFYYRHLAASLAELPRGQAVLIATEAMRRDMPRTIERACELLDHPPIELSPQELVQAQGPTGQPARRHAAADFGLDAEAIYQACGRLEDYFPADAEGVIPAADVATAQRGPARAAPEVAVCP